MKFIKFKETIFNINTIEQINIHNASILMTTTNGRNTYSLDFDDHELTQKAFEKIGEFLSNISFKGQYSQSSLGFGASTLLDLDKIANAKNPQ